MKYISQTEIANEIYQTLGEKIWFDKGFVSGVLKEKLNHKIWIDFSSIFTEKIFPVFERLAGLTGNKEYFIAYHPDDICSYRDTTGSYPIISVAKGDSLQHVCTGPEGQGIENSLCIAHNVFYIFDAKLKWLLYCERQYEVAMLVVFDETLVKHTETLIKQLFLEAFDNSELLTIEEYFDPDWYDYLTAFEREKITTLYKTVLDSCPTDRVHL